MSRRPARRWPTIHWPTIHWPSVRGRALADAGPLLLVGGVVVVISLLVGAVPALLVATEDQAVQQALGRAGDRAAVRVHAQWEHDDGLVGRLRTPRLAEDVDDFRARAARALGPDLRALMLPPIAAVTSLPLTVTEGDSPRSFQLGYLARDPGAGGAPGVTWIAGGPPPGTAAATAGRVEVRYTDPPWLVQVGLSERAAAALNVQPGARIPLQDSRKQVKNVRVSGIYRADDRADPAWQVTPWLLDPIPNADGVGSRLGGLLSADSLPDARLAFDNDDLRRTIWFTPDTGVVTWDRAQAMAATVVTLKATSGSSSGRDASLKWETQLDAVLDQVRQQIDATAAQAAVLLIGVLAATVLVLLLAADLLVRRRAPALATARLRGASLPGLGVELLIESAALALAAAATGLGLARALVPGAAWGWVLPLAVGAAAAGPVFGTLAAARATRDRRAPANRSARRFTQRTTEIRRATLEVAVVLAAVAAFVALEQRGITADSGTGGGTALPASAALLGALAGAVLLLRLLPAGARLALSRAVRSRRPLAVFVAARAVATAARALPPLALVTSTALASFALTLAVTADRGVADGAWRSVGADARLDLASAATPELTQRLAAAPGVQQAVAGQVSDGTRFDVGTGFVYLRLVVVDAAAFQRLLASTPLPDAPELSRLTPAGTGAGDVAALVRSGDGSLRPGMRLSLPREGVPPIDFVAVGDAPAVGDAADVIVVDAGALAAAGRPTAPNTVWVTGPGAAQAVRASAGDRSSAAVVRAEVQSDRRGAPLTAGMLSLAWATAATLLALGLLGFALGAAAGSSERWQTLSRLRTLGLRPRDVRRIAAGELLPPVLMAGVGGPLIGLLLARLTLDPLALRQLTGQLDDPRLAAPWWGLGLMPLVLLAAIVVVAPVESALRRRRRLGEVLRAGEG